MSGLNSVRGWGGVINIGLGQEVVRRPGTTSGSSGASCVTDWSKIGLKEIVPSAVRVFLSASSLLFSSQGISEPIYFVSQSLRTHGNCLETGPQENDSLESVSMCRLGGSCMSGYIWCLWLYHKFPQTIIIIYDTMVSMSWKFRWSYPGP